MKEKKATDKYDFEALVASYPKLKNHIFVNKHGTQTINFADSEAVRALNYALLANLYNITNYALPPQALIPPIPGRATYIEAIAQLLPTGASHANIKVLDIGVGANCIYPIIGVCSFGWQFVGSDVDVNSLRWAAKIVAQNKQLEGMVELREQPNPNSIFEGVVTSDDYFQLSICNPPFHSSPQTAQKATLRKLRNLQSERNPKVEQNFKGQSTELWCKGGEREFIKRMIEESTRYERKVGWFTTLVSKEENIKPLVALLEKNKFKEYRIIKMHLGNKSSHILAWKGQLSKS